MALWGTNSCVPLAGALAALARGRLGDRLAGIGSPPGLASGYDVEKIDVGTYFKKLNDGWDAEGGAPEPSVRIEASGLTLTFFLNSGLNPKFRHYDRGQIFFPNCWRYRLGDPNDEGWHKGHCRFRCLAPEWGKFYEISGDLLDHGPKDWVTLKSVHSDPSKHFLFYFKDETFECDAEEWSFKVLPVSDTDYERLQSAERVVTLPRDTLLSLLRALVHEPIRIARRWLRRTNTDH